MNVRMASTIAMLTPPVLMYLAAITVIAEQDLLEAESTAKVRIK